MYGDNRQQYGHNDLSHYDRNQDDEFGYSEDTKLCNDLDIVIRHGFIRKVFSIVAAQLLFTSLIALPFYLNGQYLRTEGAGSLSVILILVSVLTIGLMCYMSCNPQVGREYPKNYIILALITGGMGCMVGVATIAYTAQSILLCAGMTAVITFCLMGFAMQTKVDFTGAGPYLFAALICLTLFGFVLMFIHSQIAHTVYAAGGALLFSFYLIYDTQLIVGGNNKKHQFGLDDYVFAALTLYLDIINLFLYLLELFGDRR